MEYPIDRRELLKRASLTGLAGVPALLTGPSTAGLQQISAPAAKNISNRIVQENSLPGTTDWQLTRVLVNAGQYRTTLIEGYCNRQSVSAGEQLSFYVSTDPVRSFQIDIYRLGYYGGTGGRLIRTLGPFPGSVQKTPAMSAEPERLRECAWDSCCEITIPPDWVSGVYLGKLTTIPENSREPYWQSYIIFIVKDDRHADLLFPCSDNTWQAYNRWPVNESLYTHPAGAHAPEVSVSFDRPYGKYCQIFEHPLSIGSGEFLLWEFPLAYWLEQQGYDVTYGSNSDCVSSSFLNRCRIFLSVGHDEYWDIRQYRAVEEALEQGVHFLWLCGNSVFVDSPFSHNATGQPLRRLTRAGFFGEVRGDEMARYANLFAGTTGTAPDERKIMGVRSVVPFNGGGDWTCTNPEHWLFTGTGMKQGDSIPGLVGWEHHGEPDLTLPNMEVVAAGMIWTGGVHPGRYESVVFAGPRKNVVFNASTIFWSQGLAAPPGHWLPWSHGTRPHGPDVRVQQMTRNLIDHCLQTSTDR